MNRGDVEQAISHSWDADRLSFLVNSKVDEGTSDQRSTMTGFEDHRTTSRKLQTRRATSKTPMRPEAPQLSTTSARREPNTTKPRQTRAPRARHMGHCLLHLPELSNPTSARTRRHAELVQCAAGARSDATTKAMNYRDKYRVPTCQQQLDPKRVVDRCLH